MNCLEGRPVLSWGKEGLGRLKGIGEFGAKKRRLVESNFRMTLRRRNAVRGLYG